MEFDCGFVKGNKWFRYSINAKLKMHKIANSKCTILAERS